MKKFHFVLRPAKGALIFFALSIILTLFIIIGLSHYHTTQKFAFAQIEGELQGALSENQTLSDDLASLETHLTSFNHLASIGLIGHPKREIWVHNLEEIYKALDLPPTLHYRLAPPQFLVDTQDATPGVLPLSQDNPLRHDLDITLSDIHEEEFLTFIGKLQTDWQTPFRIETCQMTRKSEDGLHINCTLRLFSLPLMEVDPQTGS